MNTLVYADIDTHDAGMASTIASTLQQMLLSFGVATASLAAAIFIRDRFHSGPSELIHGIHAALVTLGLLTVLSALVFRELKPADGASVSKAVIHSGS
jgi:hypothetical protein